MRDAMSLTDQAIAFGEGKVLAEDVRSMLGTLDHGQVYGVLQALLEGDARALLEAVRHLAEQGPDWGGVLAEILNVLHRVAIAQALPEAVDNGQGDRERVLALAQALPNIPENCPLTNVWLSILLARRGGRVRFCPISFRPRQGGVNSLNLRRIVPIGLRAVGELWALGRALDR